MNVAGKLQGSVLEHQSAFVATSCSACLWPDSKQISDDGINGMICSCLSPLELRKLAALAFHLSALDRQCLTNCGYLLLQGSLGAICVVGWLEGRRDLVPALYIERKILFS